MSVPTYTDKDLYGASGQPQSADIMQGPLGDCYLLSSLGSVASRQPGTIQNAIHYNADKDSFSVTMYQESHGGFLGLSHVAKPVQVEVTQADLQVDRGMGVDSQGHWNKTEPVPLWPQVMESAYAKLNADRSPEAMQDELLHIERGYPSTAMYALTGQHDKTLPAQSLSHLDKTYEGLQQAMQEGRPMMLSTNPMKDIPNDGLVKGVWNDIDPSKSTGHAYMLEGVNKDDAGNVMLTLRNPWGRNNFPEFGVTDPNPTVTVNLKQIIDNGHLQSIDVGPAATQQLEQTQQHNQPGTPTKSEASPAAAEMSSGCPYVDRMIASLNDPAAFSQTLRDLSNSPIGDAFRAEGRALNLDLQNQQLQQQVNQQQAVQVQAPVQQGPVMSR